MKKRLFETVFVILQTSQRDEKSDNDKKQAPVKEVPKSTKPKTKQGGF